MKIKTIMRYYFTSIRMAIIKKIKGKEKERKEQVLARMWRNWTPWALLEMWNSAATMEKSMTVLKNTENRTTLWPSNSNSGYTPERTESRNMKKYLHTHMFYSKIIHNSQKPEATQVSPEGWVGKQNVVCTYHRILFSL